MVLPQALRKTEVILTCCWDEIIWFLGFKNKTGAAGYHCQGYSGIDGFERKQHFTISLLELLEHTPEAETGSLKKK